MSELLRNLTNSPAYNVELVDLGITIEVGIDYDTSEVDPTELGNSSDLAAAITAGELVFLNGAASPIVPLSETESQAILNASTNPATNILGTENFFPKWADDCPCTLTESNMYQDPITGYIGINLTEDPAGSPQPTPATDLEIKGALQLTGSTSGYTRFSVPASGDNVVYTLPSNDGNTNQVLQTNGTGTLTWVNQTVGTSVLNDLDDVTTSAPASGEVLVYQGSPAEWQNNTLSEAGISAVGHTHVMANITDSTWISDITAEPIGDLSDVTLASVGSGEILVYQGSPAEWQNNTLAEAGISATGHNHTKSDITDFTESDYVHTTGVETVGGNKTFSNNVIVSGDLTVNGTTTSVNTATLEIADNIYLLNSGMAGSPLVAPTQDAGFEVARGSSTNVSWLWDETLDTFRPKLGSGEAALGYVLDPTDANGVGDRGYNDLRYAALSHTHVMVDITDSTWISDITNEPIGDLSDVTLASVGSGEILVYQGSPAEWQNNTLAEAGISATGHTHVMANITDSTWISDITNEPIGDLSDVTITTLGVDELLFTQDGSTWINQTLAEAGIASTSHTHALNDLTDVTIGSPTPAVDDVLTYNGSTWQAQAGTGMYSAYAHLEDQKSSGTAGGTFSSGAWRTRTLNTEVVDSGGIVSISSNQFTLQAGTYLIIAIAPAYGVNLHKCRLRNITDAVTEGYGSSEKALYSSGMGGGPTNATHSRAVSRVTIASAKVFEIQHRCSTSRSTDGFGENCSFGVTEVYTQVDIWKEN